MLLDSFGGYHRKVTPRGRSGHSILEALVLAHDSSDLEEHGIDRAPQECGPQYIIECPKNTDINQ